MIKDNITITKSNYNLQEWEASVIKRCLEDNPSSNNIEISALIGISERSLHRICERHGIEISHQAKTKRYNKMLQETKTTKVLIIR